MHRIVIFSQPVTVNGEILYGKLYAGETEDKLIASAAADLKKLLLQEQFVGQQGEEVVEIQYRQIYELYWVWNSRRPVCGALLDSPDLSRTGQQMGPPPNL